MMRREFGFSGIELIAALLFGLFGQSLAQNAPPIRSLPMPEARVSGGPEHAQGNVWLHWSTDHQLGYIQGWMDGGYWGYFDACTESRLAAPNVGGLQEKCMEHIPSSHLMPEEYLAEVTEFYSKYPEDRALPIRRALGKFLEPGMNPDGVHRWLDQLIESMKRSEAK